MTRSIVLSSLKYFLVDLIGKIVVWPLWWYTIGLKQLLSALALNIIDEEHRLGVGLWWKNLFTPMYGQYDWQGRIISFVIRIVMGIVRTLLLVVWFAISLTVLALWVALLPVAAYFLWLNLSHYVEITWWYPT